MSHFDPKPGYNPDNPFIPKPIDFDFATGEAPVSEAEALQTHNLPLEDGSHSVSRKKPSKAQTKEIAQIAAAVLLFTPETTPPDADLSLKVSAQLKKSSKSSFKRILEVIYRKFTYTFGGLSRPKKTLLDTLEHAIDDVKQPLNATKIATLKEKILTSAGKDKAKLQAIHELIRDNYSMLLAHIENPKDTARLVCEFCKASPKDDDGKIDLKKFTRLWIPTLSQALISKSALQKKASELLQSNKGSLMSALQELLILSLQNETTKPLFEQLVQTLVATGIEREKAQKYLISELLIESSERIKSS